jgi:hypothetical protein
MKNKLLVFTAVFLMIAIGNYFRIVKDHSIRTVDFLSVFAIGALSGVLVVSIVKTIKDRNKSN